MKKVRSFLLVLIAVSCIGCSGNGENAKDVDGGEEWASLYEDADLLYDAADISTAEAMEALSAFYDAGGERLLSASASSEENKIYVDAEDADGNIWRFVFDEDGAFLSVYPVL